METRPTKYRGRTASGNWIYGGVTQDKRCIVQGRDFVRVIPETVTQSTGKYDYQFHELFDGDVLEFKEAGQLMHGVIEWSDDSASIQVKCKVSVNGTQIYGLNYYNLKRMKRIGNIFDDDWW